MYRLSQTLPDSGILLKIFSEARFYQEVNWRGWGGNNIKIGAVMYLLNKFVEGRMFLKVVTETR
jgi:hypothetical protein